MRSLKSFAHLVLITLGLFLGPTFFLSGCGGGGDSASVVTPPISVSVDPAAITLSAGDTQSLMASLKNDSTQKGVTWTISPASGAGTLSDPTSTAVIYNAPTTTPSSDVTVSVTATSISDPTKSGAVTITVAAILLSLTPPSADVPAGKMQPLTVAAQYDPAPPEVTWAIAPRSGAGSLSDETPTSAIYHAPANAPQSPLTVRITATLIGDNPVSASATITVPAIQVTISPTSSLLQTGSRQAFAATVNNDPTSSGVTWSLAQSGKPCAPDCGTIVPVDAMTANFTAPASQSAVVQVSVIATSLTDPTKSGSATVTFSTVTIDRTRLDFGRVHKYTKVSRWTTLSNAGTTAITISGTTISGPSASSYVAAKGCNGDVAPGASCDIVVSFFPNSYVGTYTASLEITDSSADSPHVVSLTGYGCGKCLTPAAVTVLAATKVAVVPRPTGTNAVGTSILQVTDSNRADPFLADGSRRELMLRFWYPAAVGDACSKAAYTSPEVWTHFSQLVGQPLPTVRTNSCLNARIADGAYPIVLFSHGLTGTNTDYTYLIEDLASRGYVVVSVDHTHEATAVAFTDGRMVKSFYGSHLTRIVGVDESALSLIESARLADLQFVVDELQRLNTQVGSRFAAHLDTTAIATAGHSLGGLTALQALEADPRIRAAVSLDGIVPGASYGTTDKAVLILDTDRTQWSEDKAMLWSKLRGPRLAVNLWNSEHLTPSDLVWLARGAVKTGSMSPETAIAVMRDYVATFLDAQLLGRPARYLEWAPVSDDVEITLPTQVPELSVSLPAAVR